MQRNSICLFEADAEVDCVGFTFGASTVASKIERAALTQRSMALKKQQKQNKEKRRKQSENEPNEGERA